MRRLALRSAIAAAVAVSSVGLLAPTALAAENLPSCTTVRQTSGITTQTVYVTNNCSYSVGYYVDKEGPNSRCFFVNANGGKSSYQWTKRDVYHGTYRCYG